MTTTIETPQDTVDALEARARAGEPVDPGELAQAIQARDTAARVAELQAEGERSRAEKAAEKARVKAIADAKVAAAKDLAGKRAGLEDLYGRAVTAMIALGDAGRAYGEAVTKHGQHMQSAGIVSSMSGRELENVPGLDRANYVDAADGTVRAVTVDGVLYRVAVGGALSAAISRAQLFAVHPDPAYRAQVVAEQGSGFPAV